MGKTTLSIPMDNPVMILVAAPVVDALANLSTGEADVYHSVISPMAMPAILPMAIAQKTPGGIPLTVVII